MESFCPETQPLGRRKAVTELLNGYQLADKLKAALREPYGDDYARELVTGILNSLSNTISILDGAAESDEISQFLPQVGSPCFDGRKSEDSVESSKTSTLKDRRGSYKRKKSSQSWTTESAALVDDGHAWRKYGQKVILRAKHPRNYFRCTHKYDQGCQATKQVQRIDDEEETPLFRTTYFGRHTCKSPSKPSQIFLESSSDSKPEKLLSFSNNGGSPVPPVSFFASIKQEYAREDMQSHPTPTTTTAYHHHSSSSDYLGLSPFNSSGSISTHSLDLDMIVGESVYSFDDDVLQQFSEFS